MLPRELLISFTFSDQQTRRLQGVLLEVKSNPYRDYLSFKREIAEIADSGELPSAFMACVQEASCRDMWDQPFHFIENAPLDPDLPVFDNRDPVSSKRATKKTFVSEGFLELYTKLSGFPAIGQRSVNDGDIFHDIYPMEALFNSQCQKSLGPFRFHKDMACEHMPLDYVNILAVRSSTANQIYTTFVGNREALRLLEPETCAALECKAFYTRFNPPSASAERDVGTSMQAHAVLQREQNIFFFEGFTRGMTPRAEQAIDMLTAALHRCKRRVLMLPGDFVSISNNTSLHGKEVGEVSDAAAARRRWSVKTVNIRSLEQLAGHLISPGSYVVDV